MNFSDFCDSNLSNESDLKENLKYENFQKNSENTQKNQQNNAKSTNFSKNQKNFYYNEKLKSDIEQQYKKYENMSRDNLLNELFKEVSKQKQNGTFDKNKLNSIKEMMLPYLDDAGKKNLESIINMLNV